MASYTIVGLGEALFDLLPDRAALGGAPLNVAVHAHQLAQPTDGRGVVASRVGQDEMGRQVHDQLRSRGMSTTHLQTDPDRPTGTVRVSFNENHEPEYEIVEGAAWDALQWDPDWEDLARRCQAVCFGSLAQRDPQARSAVRRFLDTARQAHRLFDVNLRQHYYDRGVLHASCEAATLLKLNQQELPVVLQTLGLDAEGDAAQQADRLIKRYKLRLIALTRGERGTLLLADDGRRLEGEPVSYPPAEDADTVGAGDACSAGLLVGIVRRLPLERTLALANSAGAFVASQPGATPTLPDDLLTLAR